MPDPVSWLLIRPGWKVLTSEGHELGEVDLVAGDTGADGFDGLAVAVGALGKQRYVPAEQVGAIDEGAVHLTITAAQAESLGEYVEPASSIAVEADNRPGPTLAADARRLATDVVEPVEQAHTASFWERLAYLLRRLRS